MATSGTYTFDPRIAECLDEAWERCGHDPAALDVRHIVAAKRSLNLLLRSELSAEGINLWTVSEVTATPAQSATSTTLGVGAIDVLEATVRDSSDNETPMIPIGRSEWRAIPDKTIEGRPDRYWVERGLDTKTVHFWPAQDAHGHTLVMNVLFGIEDAGDLANEAAVPTLWFDVVCAGLARRLATKWAPDRMMALKVEFEEALRLARQSNRERASVILEPYYDPGGMRW